MISLDDLRKREPEKREYRTTRIVVTWEPDLCVHATECILHLPRVFNPRRRPWVSVSQAEPEDIARVVAMCPSRALKYELLEEGTAGA